MQSPRMTSQMDLSVPPPSLPFMPVTNSHVALPPPNLILPPCPPTLQGNLTTRFSSENVGSRRPRLPFLLVRHNEKYILKFNNLELLPQYLIEEDLWHRFGIMSCSVVINRNLDTGSPITDDEVQIHFNELSTAEKAFKELCLTESYCDLKFHEECVPPAHVLETIEVSQSLDHFYCLTFKDDLDKRSNLNVEQLKEIFSLYGHVANVNKDRVGNVYIRYSEKHSAQLALFHLANDPLIQLRNARNLKENNNIKVPRIIKHMIDSSKVGKDHSTTEDDSASTTSADLSMMEMKTIEDAIMSQSILLD